MKGDAEQIVKALRERGDLYMILDMALESYCWRIIIGRRGNGLHVSDSSNECDISGVSQGCYEHHAGCAIISMINPTGAYTVHINEKHIVCFTYQRDVI